jgi:hypothetical protein
MQKGKQCEAIRIERRKKKKKNFKTNSPVHGRGRLNSGRESAGGWGHGATLPRSILAAAMST